MAAIKASVPSMTGLPKVLDLSPLRGKTLRKSGSDNLTQDGEEWLRLDELSHSIRSRGEGWVALFATGIVALM